MINIRLMALNCKVFGVVAAGVIGTMGVNPMMVHAQGNEVACICENKCSVEESNKECLVCSADYRYCQAEEIAVKHGDSGIEEELASEEEELFLATEEQEEGEHFGPLTPDGNLSLVDDYGSLEAGGKQFITVVSKSGHYFYIIIDRDDKGTETVHFLNLVDEADLLNLMEDEEVEAYMEAKNEEVTIKLENGTDGDTEDPVVIIDKPKADNTKLFIGIGGLALLGGAAFFMFMKPKAQKPKNTGVDPDADYREDEDNVLNQIPEEKQVDENMQLDPDADDRI